MDHAAAMQAFARLARISQLKRQLLPRDKFLILAGAAACRAGWPDVAERCRQLILAHNPAHLIKSFESFPDALRDGDFAFYVQQLAKFCPYERAEHLLARHTASERDPLSTPDSSAGEVASQLLQGPEWMHPASHESEGA